MKINSQKIYTHRSYSIKELSDVLTISEKTCFRWIDEGLEIILGCKKPILIKGEKIKEFIKNRKQKNKIKLNRNQFFCMKCKDARYAKRGSIKIVGNKKTARCRACNGKICRTI